MQHAQWSYKQAFEFLVFFFEVVKCQHVTLVEALWWIAHTQATVLSSCGHCLVSPSVWLHQSKGTANNEWINSLNEFVPKACIKSKTVPCVFLPPCFHIPTKIL